MIGTDIKVYDNGAVIGTFKYVTDYIGFDNNEDNQQGYFFPFHLEQEGEKLSLVKNGKPNKTDLDWEADNVLKIEPDVKWEIIVDGESVITFSFKTAKFDKAV